MGGYIGARAGTISATVANVPKVNAQDITATDTTPEVTIINNTHEDTDGGREGKVIFKGQQSGGEESTLAEIQGSHDGTADDEKGDLIFKTNDGSDGASPTERLRIDSDGSILTATLGTDNVHIGEGAAASIASGGNQNVAIGKDAGTALTTGDSNTFIGAKVGDAITTASANVAIGGDATYAALGSDTQGKFTTAIGVGALRAQNFTSDTASNNTAVGYFAGGVMTTGTANTFIGGNAGDDCVDGIQNVAVGYAALSADAGNNNTAVGESALTSTTGANNTAIGPGAGNTITSGSFNTIVGGNTGNAEIDIRTADNRVILADGAGNICLYGDNNSQAFFGDMALQTDGANLNVNVAGSQMGLNLYQDASGDTILCKMRHARANVGNYASATMVQFCRDNGAEIGSIKGVQSNISFNTSSDYRLKENVDYDWDATTRLKKLKPARFNWIADDTNTLIDGFLAHEAAEAVPEAVEGVKDATHDVENVVLSASNEVISQGTPEDYWTTRKADILYTEDDTLPDGKSVGDVKEEAKFPSDSKWVAKHTVPKHQQIDHSKMVPLLVKTILELEARITVLEAE